MRPAPLPYVLPTTYYDLQSIVLNTIISFSLRNRGFIFAATGVLLLGGIVAFSRLPIDAVPDITNNQVQILTNAPALSALEMERYVTFPIELSVKAVPDVVELRSLSRPGLSVITVVFDESVDIYFGRQLLLEALRGVEEDLPEGVGMPELGPVTTGLGEIFRYVVRDTTGRRSPQELRTIQDWIVRRELLGAEALAEVNSLGGEMKQYQVLVDPDRIASYDLTLRDVFHAASEATGNAGGGYIEVGPEQLAVRSVGLATSLEDLRSAVVHTTSNGVPVTLGDIAEVTTGPALRFGSASQDGKGEVVVGIVMQLKGANARVTVNAVKDRIDEIEQALPEGVVIEPFYDREVLVDRTIETVATNLIEGALLVIGVLLLLLVSLRAGLILASVIPLAMCFAGIMMYLSGQSGNLMSLGAIDFGLVVDGSLIIVENILRLLERFHRSGENVPLTSDRMKKLVFDGAVEVRKAAQFGEIIIIVVYLPILTLVGIEGKLFRPMALTVSFALLGALILSITWVPAISSFVLRGQKKFRESPVIEWLRRAYRPLLDRTLARPTPVLLGAVVIVGIGIVGFTRLGGEFIPRLDEGDIAMHLIRLPSISLSESQKLTTQTERLLITFPEVRTVVSHTGRAEVSTDPMGFELADVFIMLRPEEEWTTGRTKEELIEEMEHRIAEEVPGVGTQFLQPIEMRTNELIAGARGDLVVKVFGEDFGTTARIAREVATIMRSTPGGADVSVEQTEGLPQLVIRPDRSALARYGMTVEELNDVVEIAVAGLRAGEVFEGERRFDLVVRLQNEHRNDPTRLRNLRVTTPTGPRLPLSELADIRIESGPVQISREEGARFTSAQANVRDRDVASYVEEVSAEVGDQIDLPEGYRIDYGGAFENLQEGTARLMVVVPIALLLVFLLLYRTFRSIRVGAMIFLCIPMAVVGGVAALLIRDIPFSISAGVGFIALFGIAVLNGIVLLAAVRNYRAEGLSHLESIRRGADDRLRPVIATAALAGFGFLPMMLSTSAGAEVQRPLATVVVGGLISSTILTLFVLPAIYRRFGDKRPKNRDRSLNPLLLLLLFMLVGGNELRGQEVITQEEFLERVMRTSGVEGLLEGEARAVAAERRGAEVISPIRLNAGVEEIPTGSLTGESKVSLGVSGWIRYPGTWSRRREAREAALGVVEAEAGPLYRSLRERALGLWYRMVEARLQIALVDSAIHHAREVMRIVRVRRDVGEIDSLEAVSAELMLARSVVDSIEAAGHLREASTAGAVAAGFPVGTLLRPAEETDLEAITSETTEELIERAVAADPTIRLARARLRLVGADAAASAIERKPSLNLGVDVSAIDGEWGYLGGSVGLELPIGRWGEDPATAAFRYRAEVVRQEIEIRQLQIRRELAPLIEEIRTTARLVEEFDRRVHPLLLERWRLALRLYSIGASDYLTVADAHEDVVEEEFDHLTLRVQLSRLIDEVEVWIGEE